MYPDDFERKYERADFCFYFLENQLINSRMISMDILLVGLFWKPKYNVEGQHSFYYYYYYYTFFLPWDGHC